LTLPALSGLADFGQSTQEEPLGVFTQSEREQLLDQQATQENLLASFEGWGQSPVGPGDLQILLISGRWQEDRRGVPYLLTYQSDPESLRRTALSIDDFLDLYQQLAGGSLLLLDVSRQGEPESDWAAEISEQLEGMSGGEDRPKALLLLESKEAGPAGNSGELLVWLKSVLDGEDLNGDGVLGVMEFVESFQQQVGEKARLRIWVDGQLQQLANQSAGAGQSESTASSAVSTEAAEAREVLSGEAAKRQLLEVRNCVKCDLTKANLFGANLFGANLTGANLRETDLYGAKFCITTMPDGGINNDGC